MMEEQLSKDEVDMSVSERSRSSPNQRPSYLDPCVLSSSGLYPPTHNFDEAVIKRLDSELLLLSDTISSTDVTINNADEEKLKTFLRIRPVVGESALEIKDENIVVVSTKNPSVHALLQDRGKKQTGFKFTKILGPACGQTAFFDECVTPIIEKFLRRENCLIFSYGATNSGKTYTMQGYGNEYGIIPRTLDYIFTRLQDQQYKFADIRPHLYQSFQKLNTNDVEILHEKKRKIIADANIKQELMNSYRLTTSRFSDRSGSTVELIGSGDAFYSNPMYANSTVYSIWVSFAEIYNERVYDLLETSTIAKNKRRKELRLMQDRNGYAYIKDLTELPVTSDEEAYKLFLAGRKNLQFAATQMNQHSSRSHSFFTIRVVSIGVSEAEAYPKTVHRMTFCDLAGMERAKQTENKGFRLHESGNINNSLTTLLKVIRALREKQATNSYMETVPFRDSKLTHIFKSYFTSATHICMVVNVNPDPSLAESTLQVLQNSAIASNVVVFRPMDVNVEVQPEPVPVVKDKGSKPLVPSNGQKSKPTGAKEKRRLVSSSESEDSSDSDGEEYGAETVVAPKTLFQQVALLKNQVLRLQTENLQLKNLLRQSEAEKDKLREDMMNLVKEERTYYHTKLAEVKASEETFGRRRLSLVHKASLSPGNKCGRCSPPTCDMEDIDETFEEYEDDVESDKENCPA